MPVLIQKKNKRVSRRITAPIAPVGEPFVVSEADSSVEEPDDSGIVNILKQTKSPISSTTPSTSNSPQIANDENIDEPDDSGVVSALKAKSPNTSIQTVNATDEPDASGVINALASKSTSNEDEEIERIYTTNTKLKSEIPIEYYDIEKDNSLSAEEKEAFRPIKAGAFMSPEISAHNPYTLLKPRTVVLPTSINITGANNFHPSNNDIINATLRQIDPELENAANDYKQKTGRDLIFLDKQPDVSLVNGQWVAKVALTEASARVLNAYAKYGLNAAKQEQKKVNGEQAVYAKEYNEKKQKLNDFVKEHPYIAAVDAGVYDVGIAYEQLGHNAKMLSRAIITSTKYGFDSPEYDELIKEDRKQQEAIYTQAQQIPANAIQGFGPNAVRIGVGAGGALPKMFAAGETLPLLVFLENAHRGAIEASKNAFMFLPMMGAGKFLGGTLKSAELEIKPLLEGGGLLEETPTTIGGLSNQAVYAANFSLASRAIRQLEVRGGQGAIMTLTDFASNPSTFLNGDKPFSVYQNVKEGKSLFREGAGIQAIGSLATGVLFPTGKVSPESAFPLTSTPEDIITNSASSALLSDVPRSDAISEMWNGNWDDVVLNYLTLKKNKETGAYQTGDLQKDVDRLSNINQSLETLESVLPKEWIDYVSQHENEIRTAKQGGETRRQFRAKAQKMRENSEISSNVEKISTFDVADWMKEGHSKFGKTGENNEDVPQEKAARDFAATKVSLEQQINIEHKRIGGERGAIGEFEPNQDRVSRKWYDENKARLSRIGAFYIEAGIGDFSEFSNRLQNDLGSEAFDRLGHRKVREIYEEGQKFYDSNIADPFFSGLKQNVIERFPDGNMNVKSARNLINRLGTADEIAWTTGLEQYLNDAEKSGKPINKTELVKVIQDGQIKVNETMLGNKFTNQEWYEFYELKAKEKEGRLIDAEKERLSELRYQLGQNELKSTRYDLETYGSGEKLELEGGKESKEVLLQIPRRSLELPDDLHIESGIDYSKKIKDDTYNNENYTLVVTNDTNQVVGIGWESGEEGAKRSYFDNKLGKEEVFTHAHYSDFPNYFAHFRANFRTLIDGITKVFHGEEFQSDWNQEGRKKGYKLNNNEKIRLEQIEQETFDRARKSNDQKVLDLNNAKEFGRYVLKSDINRYLGEERANEWSQLKQKSGDISKNPFMENNWKELAFKRFLRMGIEKGADGVSWTTARQQQERYGKLYEGKYIKYRNIEEGVYELSLGAKEDDGAVHYTGKINVKESELDSYIGKPTADRIRQAKPEKLYTTELDNPVKLGEGYSDYDTYFVNLAKKIAKRFGGEYRVERIETTEKTHENLYSQTVTPNEATQLFNAGGKVYAEFENSINDVEAGMYEMTSLEELEQAIKLGGKLSSSTELVAPNRKIEEVHFLSISPQMRASLKQGFPFYGLGLEELPISQRKTGIRNQIFPRVEFDSNLRDVIDSLSNAEHPESGTVFNSGLNPHAFAHQVRVLYQGFKDATSFAHQLIADYGEEIKPHIEKLWNFVTSFKDTLFIPKVSDEIAKRLEARREKEGGFLGIGGEKEVKEGMKEARTEFGRNVAYSSMRSITLAQINKYFRQVYEGMRDVRLTLNGYSSVLIQQMKDARDLAGFRFNNKLQRIINNDVARALYTLNEEGSRSGKRTYYDDNTLKTRFGFLHSEHIQAFRKVRQAQNDILNLRMKQELYHDYKKLATQTPNSPEYLATEQHINETKSRYQYLKDTGYLSLQRRGNIAIYAEDKNYPVGDERRVIYTHAKNWKEAKRIELDYKRQGFSNIEKHKIFKLKGDLDFMRRLTPSQLQDAIISSGADPATRYWDAATNSWQDTEIGKITNEVLSRYSSQSYKIQRNLVRGYEVSWKNLLDTMLHQARVYSSSFYSDIGRENALDMLNASGIRDFTVKSNDANGNIVNRKFQSKSDANAYKNTISGLGHTDISVSHPDITTYNVTKSYIEDETTPSSRGVFGINKRLSQVRAITYITQMGLDVSQFLINLTQPFVMTYAQLAKSEQTGLNGLKPEVIMTKAWYDVAKLLNYERKINSARKVGLTPKSGLPKEMTDLFHRAIDEDVVKAELTTGYAASQLGAGSKLEKVADFTSVFARAGEHVTRTQAFAAFYHAGKEKGLTGNSLYNFIVENIKQTHGESSYGEAPRIIRSMGEFGRLFYQFGAFNHMWWENLGTSIKSDVNTKALKGLAGGATVRHLGAMGVVSGLVGLPLAAGIRAVIATIYGHDKQKQFENSMKERISEQGISPETSETLKNLALYGFTGRRGVSSRLGMRVPVIDSIADAFTIGPDILDSIPAVATAKQFLNAPKDLLKHEGFRFAEDISPRASRNIIRAFRFERYGARQRAEYGQGLGDVIVPKGRFSNWDLYLQGIGITPTQVTNEYEKKKYEALGTFAKSGKRSLKRYFNQYAPTSNGN